MGSPCWCFSFVTISVIYLRSTCSIQDNKRHSLKLLSGGIRFTEHRQESWQVPTASLFRDQPFPMKERGDGPSVASMDAEGWSLSRWVRWMSSCTPA